jgi:hypothetical protein
MTRAAPTFALSLAGVGVGVGVGLAALASAGCSSSTQPLRVVMAAPPPKDDGKSANGDGGKGGSEHSAALEQLKIGVSEGRNDKQNSVRVPLPDAEHWTRVRFWGVPSLVGFRYGKEHHAIVAAFITHVDDNTVQGACTKSFEVLAGPMMEAFDVDVKHDAPIAVMWNKVPGAAKVAPVPIDIDPVIARTATMASRESYAAAYATYPAWGKESCLVVGVAVPARDDEPRAKDVRDRFAKDVLPNVQVLTKEEPKERF